MGRMLCTFVTAALLLSWTGTARAANEVTVIISGTGVGRPATIFFDDGEDIKSANGLPNIESTDTRINVFSTGATANIGRITLNGSARSTDLELFIGQGSFPTTQDDLPSEGLDWAGLVDPPVNLEEKIVLAGAIDGNTTGSIKVHSVYRLEIGGQLKDPLTATAAGTEAIEYLEFDSNASGGTVTAGGIVELLSFSTTTPIAGAITSTNAIGDIMARGGIASTATISAEAGINSIISGYETMGGFVGQDIEADIYSDTGIPDASGIYYLQCGTLSGNLYAYSLGELTAVSIDGIIAEEVTTPLVFHDIYYNIRVGEFTGDGRVKAMPGKLYSSIVAERNITSVEVNGIFSDAEPIQIISRTGAIGSIISHNEIDGTIPGLISINAPEGIGSIECAGDMRGVAIGPQIFDNSTPGIFVGTIVAGSMENCSLHLTSFDVIAAGTFAAPSEGRIVTGTIPATSLLRIEGVLGPNAIIRTESASPGLAGQVIIGAEGINTGSISVRTGSSTELLLWDEDPTEYTYLRSQVGGGAVGLVPFHLHEEDSFPPSDPAPSCPSIATKTWPGSHGGGTRETIVLQFYGPVFDSADGRDNADEPETVPVVVTIQSIALCNPDPCWDEEKDWTDRTDLFDVYVPGNASAIPGKREVWVARKMYESSPMTLANHRYRVTPAEVSNVRILRCDQVASNPAFAPEIADFLYELDPYCSSFALPPGE